MLILSRKPRQSIIINHNVKFIILGVQGNQVRIGIEAPVDHSIHRQEVYLSIQRGDHHVSNHKANSRI
jgi:carbon storage regulator